MALQMVTGQAERRSDEYLVVRGMSKEFRANGQSSMALADVNLTIKRGEFVTLIGHSGCGKSTLLSIIAGLYQQTDGDVTLEGRPIVAPGPERGVVFQHYSLLPWLSVRENVFEAVDAVHKGKSRSEKLTHVDDFLRRVGLYEHRNKKPSQISGGMKQRVAIARAFAAVIIAVVPPAAAHTASTTTVPPPIAPAATHASRRPNVAELIWSPKP